MVPPIFVCQTTLQVEESEVGLYSLADAMNSICEAPFFGPYKVTSQQGETEGSLGVSLVQKGTLVVTSRPND